MPKLKTKKSAQERFKKTKTGKILRRQARTSHLRSKQSSKTKRRKDKRIQADKSYKGTIKKMIR